MSPASPYLSSSHHNRHLSAPAKFLGHDIGEYRDVYDTLAKMADEANFIKDAITRLSEFYSKRQDYRMQLAIYILTLVTTVVAPFQLFTGLYGMNFSYMPELHYRYGYFIFWGVQIFIMVAIYAYVRHRKLLF